MVKRALALLVVVTACGDPTIPTRQPYPFADPFGDVFRWPAGLLPVRYYIDDRGPMRALVTEGLGSWEAQFLYREWRGVLEPDSNVADVIVRWGGPVPPDVAPDPGPPVPACGGLTQIVLDAVGGNVERPIRITVNELSGTFTPEQLVACYARVLPHEIGHSLGLLDHSPQTDDLMAAQPLVRVPSDRDRMTAEVLYHTPPSIGVSR